MPFLLRFVTNLKMCYNCFVMKRFILSILAFFLVFINTSVYAASNVTKRELKAAASDGFNLKATLAYPKSKTQKEFTTVVLLHSLGYNSQWWGNLEQDLLDKGFAVLAIDFRGHGASIYNAKLTKTSWKDLKNSAYAKYPDDVLKVIAQVKEENSKITFFNDWAIVGSNIGASAGVLAADRIKDKPKSIVMISPVVKTKDLYIPVSIAQLDNVDFLSITGTGETEAQESEAYLKRFAQKSFSEYVSPSKSSGMLLLKNDPELSRVISAWLQEMLR